MRIDFRSVKPGDTITVRTTLRYSADTTATETVTKVGRDYIYTGSRYSEHRYNRRTGAEDGTTMPRQIVTPEWLEHEARRDRASAFFVKLRSEWDPVRKYGLDACEAAIKALAPEAP